MSDRSGPTQLDPPGHPGGEPKATETAILPRPKSAWSADALGILVGLLGLICAVALPFAPVWTNTTTVHWPPNDYPAATTTAFFAPYRPASFDASVPCQAIRWGLETPRITTIFSTLPPASDREGMAVTTRVGEVHLTLGRHEVSLPPVNLADDTANCDLRVHSDAQRTFVTYGNQPPVTVPKAHPPEIFTFATDLPTDQAWRLSVNARTYSWFDTTSTTAKTALAVNALGLAALSLALLFFAGPRSPLPFPTLSRRARLALRWLRVRWPLLLLDAVVAGVLLLWAVIGPLTDDDGFAMMTVRNIHSAGYIGNYYRWFNASEAPFTSVQEMLRGVSSVGLGPLWLRIPSVLAGWLSWLIVSRGVVEPVVGGPSRVRAVPRFALQLVTTMFFLACWLPYNLGVRPEPFVALGAIGTFALLLKATRPGVRNAPGWLGLAVLAAGLTLTVTPTGVVTVLLVLMFAPRIYPVLTSHADWLRTVSRSVLVSCVGAVFLVVVFADSTWTAVLRANDVHDQFGPSLGWYEEISRYQMLLGTSSWGGAGKRLAVFLPLAALLIVSAGALRGWTRRLRMPDATLVVGGVLCMLAAYWLTPSKWTHHFGALAGFGSALLTIAVVLVVRIGAALVDNPVDDPGDRSVDKFPARWTEGLLFGVFGALAGAVAAALSFMGPNAWWDYSNFDMAWSDSPIRVPGLGLDSPLWWIAVGAVVGVTVFTFRTALRVLTRSQRKTAGPGWTAMPAAALTLSATASVAVLLGTFLGAAQQPGDRFSVGRSNFASLTAPNCGIEDDVQVLPVAPGGSLVPVEGTADLDGFASGAAGLPGGGPPAEAPGGPIGPPDRASTAWRPIGATPWVWGSFTKPDGAQNTGAMTSQWFALNQLTPRQRLSLWVSGKTEQGNSLSLEFGQSTADGVKTLGTRELHDPPPDQRPYDDPRHGRPKDWRNFRPWRQLGVDGGAVPPGTDRVRLHALDTTTDAQGWIAFSGPVVRNIVPLRAFLTGAEPTLVDWPIGFLFPCRTDYPNVGQGLAQAPRTLVMPPSGDNSMTFDSQAGGVFAGLPMISQHFETPSRLKGAPEHTWGHVYSVKYSIDRDAYDTEQRRVWTSGAGGDGGYPFEIFERDQ